MKRINFKKLFCFISFLFILSCIIFYGARFLKLYIENKREISKEVNYLVKTIKDNNKSNKQFKTINKQTYFVNNANNNYVEYSNILWRIVKINEDDTITLITNSSVTSLAYGKDLDYNNSYVKKWLNTNNEDLTGIFENILNKKDSYLVKTNTCTDIMDKLSNTPCSKIENDSYVSLLSIQDYINSGNKDSYLSNNEYYYLSNTNSKNKVWYINTDGEMDTNNGTDIIGIRPVITLKNNLEYVSGKGTKDNPYKIENDNGFFGSYVKIDDTIWRIYQVNDNEVRLMLDDYLKVNGTELTYIYSNRNSYHDDYLQGSIAYYLNNTFLNTLSIKDKIKEVSWSNGYYGSSSNYDYKYAENLKINTKVALISIGDIIPNTTLSDFTTLTGVTKKGSMIYSIKESKKTTTKSIQSESKIVPAISIDKSLLKGNGTKDSPYEVE